MNTAEKNSALVRKLENINFQNEGMLLIRTIKQVSELIGSNSDSDEAEKLKSDFNLYAEKGRYLVQKTFSGGIIFLREAETIAKATIRFKTPEMTAFCAVSYSSDKRNARNVKHKPNTGSIESLSWDLTALFPHFSGYSIETKTAILIFIGKYVKDICEQLNRDSWFMKYDKHFSLQLFLDGEEIHEYQVLSIYHGVRKRPKLNPERIAKRILARAEGHGLPSESVLFFVEVGRSSLPVYSEIADKESIGIPVVLFYGENDTWTLVGTEKLVSGTSADYHSVAYSEIEETAVGDDPMGVFSEPENRADFKKSEQHQILVRDVDKRMIVLNTKKGSELSSLYNILISLQRLYGSLAHP